MRLKYLFSILSLTMSATAFAVKPDILITKTGETLKVYNLEMSSNSAFYTLSERTDAPLNKINKSELMLVKKGNGKIINLTDVLDSNGTRFHGKTTNPTSHDAVTHHAIESEFLITSKKKNKVPDKIDKQILVGDGKNQVLNMKVMSEKDFTLAVTKPRKGMKYDLYEYIIPDFVKIADNVYSVVEIDKEAFSGCKKMTDVIFPETLKKIGTNAFTCCYNLKRIILPESIEEINAAAFFYCGTNCSNFESLYIPKGVKSIEVNAFLAVGPNRSWNNYYQGALTSIPDFITTGNCTNFGIDEEAVENYEKRYLNK